MEVVSNKLVLMSIFILLNEVGCTLDIFNSLKFETCVKSEKLLRIYNKSLPRCIDECANRPHCTSFNYDQLISGCEINDIGESGPTSECPGFVFSNRSEWKVVLLFYDDIGI